MADVFEISEKDLAKQFKKLMEERPEAVTRGIVSAAMLGAEVLAKAAPKDLGVLRNSVRAETQQGGAMIVIDAPHAGIVEMGSRPHTPPLQPLLDWASRHTDNAVDAQRLAKSVQFKIAKYGTKPTYFVRNKLPILRKILKAEIEHELRAKHGK